MVKRHDTPRSRDTAPIEKKKARIEPAKIELTPDELREQEEIQAANEIFQTMQVYSELRARLESDEAKTLAGEDFSELKKRVGALQQILRTNHINIDNLPSLEDLKAQRLAAAGIKKDAGKAPAKDGAKKSFDNRPSVTNEEREVNYAKSMDALEAGSDEDKARAAKIKKLSAIHDTKRTQDDSDFLKEFRKEYDPAFAWDEKIKEERQRRRAKDDAQVQANQSPQNIATPAPANGDPAITVGGQGTKDDARKADADAKKKNSPVFNITSSEWRRNLLNLADRMDEQNPADAKILRDAIDMQDVMLWARPDDKDQSPQYLRHMSLAEANTGLDADSLAAEMHRREVVAGALKSIEDAEKRRVQEEKDKAESHKKMDHMELISFGEFATKFRSRIERTREGTPTRKTLEKIALAIEEQARKNRTIVDTQSFTDEERALYEQFAPLVIGDVLDSRVEAIEMDLSRDLPPLTMEQIQEHFGQMEAVMGFNPETGKPEQGFVFQGVETQNGNGIQMVRLEKDGKEITRPLDEILELNGLPQKRFKETDEKTIGAIVAMAWEDPQNAKLIEDFFVGFKSWSSLRADQREAIVQVYKRAFEVNPRMIEHLQFPDAGLVLVPNVEQVDAEYIPPNDPRYDASAATNGTHTPQEPIDAEFTVDGKPSSASKNAPPSFDAFKDFGKKNEQGITESAKDFLYKYRETAGRLALAAVARMGFGVVGGSSLWDVGKFIRDHHKVFGSEGLAEMMGEVSMMQQRSHEKRRDRREAFDTSAEGQEYRELKKLWKGELKPDGTYEGGKMTPEQHARFEELLGKRLQQNEQRKDFYEKGYGKEYSELRKRKLREGAPDVAPLTRQELARYQELRRMRSDGFSALEDVYTKLAYIKGGETRYSPQRTLIARQLLEYFHKEDWTEDKIIESAERRAKEYFETKTTAIDAAKGVVNTAILGVAAYSGNPWVASARALNMGLMDAWKKRNSMRKENTLRNTIDYDIRKPAAELAGQEYHTVALDENVGLFTAASRGARETYANLMAENPSKDAAIRVRKYKGIGTIGSYVAIGASPVIFEGVHKGYEAVASSGMGQEIKQLLHATREYFHGPKVEAPQVSESGPKINLPYKGDAKIAISKESEHWWQQAGSAVKKAYKSGKEALHINSDHAFNEAPGTNEEFREVDPLGSVGASLGKINVENIHGKAISNALNVVVKEHFKPQLDHVAKVFGEDSVEYKKAVSDNVAKVLGGVLQHPQSFGLNGPIVINGFTEEQLRGVKWERGVAAVFGDHPSLSFSDETLTNFVAKDATLKQFFDAHPNIPVTGHNIDAVFSGKGNDLALMANEHVPTPMLTQALTGTKTGVAPEVRPGVEVAVELNSRDLHNDVANVLGGDETDVVRLYEKVGAKNDEDFILAIEKFMEDRPEDENVSDRIRDALRAINRMSDESALRGLANAAKTEAAHIVDLHGNEIAQTPQEPTLESTKTTPYDPSGVEAHEHPNGVKHLVGKPPLRPEDSVSEEGEAMLYGAEIPQDGAPVASLFDKESRLLKEFKRDYPDQRTFRALRDWATNVDQHHLRPGGRFSDQGGVFDMDQKTGIVHSVNSSAKTSLKPPTPEMMKHPFVQEVLKRIDERYQEYFKGIESDLQVTPGNTSPLNSGYSEDAAGTIRVTGRQHMVLPNPFGEGKKKPE